MHRISLIISEIYHKFLPIAERSGITINLSCPDPSIQVENPEQLVADLERSLNETLSRTSASEIQISVDRHAITITDPETTLSRTACALLSRNFLTVDSRVGFGTTISIALERPAEPVENVTTAPEISAVSLEIAENSPRKPLAKNKPAKSSPKPVKTDRKLARAAKKADRKVQKLAKKAKKAAPKKSTN